MDTPQADSGQSGNPYTAAANAAPTASPAAPAVAQAHPTLPQAPTSDWFSGLFDCFSDPLICLKGTFCLGFLNTHDRAVLDGRLVEGSDRLLGIGLCFCTFCVGLWCFDSYVTNRNRGIIRARYNFPPKADSHDFLVSYLCCFCSTCQVAREVEFRRQLNPTTRPGAPSPSFMMQ